MGVLREDAGSFDTEVYLSGQSLRGLNGGHSHGAGGCKSACVVVAYIRGIQRDAVKIESEESVSHVEMEVRGLIWALRKVPEGSLVRVHSLCQPLGKLVDRYAITGADEVPLSYRDALRSAMGRHRAVDAKVFRGSEVPKSLKVVRESARAALGVDG